MGLSDYMIKYAYTSNQGAPYELLTKLIKTRKEKERIFKYLDCMQKQGIDSKEAKDVLKKMKETGCTYAFVANSLINSFLNENNGTYDDQKFFDIFGVSLTNGDDTIDYSILMVDIFSTLYKVSKFDIHKCDVRYYSDVFEACNDILKTSFDDDVKASIALFEAGYLMDGTNSKGEVKFVSRIPLNFSIVGTYTDLAYQLFGIQDKNISLDDISVLCKESGITIEEQYKNPASKFSGLTNDSINLWVNYYLKQKNSDLLFESRNFLRDEFESDTEFIDYVNMAMQNNLIIGVSSSVGSNVKMINPSTKETIDISTDRAGHRMTFVKFDSQGNIVVDSYGIDFVLLKEDYNKLTFQLVQVKHKNVEERYERTSSL